MIVTDLRPYQREAVAKAMAYDGFAFFPEQRTGKCLISLATFDARPTKELLIVCPKRAIQVWKEQIKLHLRTYAEIYIENFERLIQDKKGWYDWADRSDFTIIVDESHRIKKRGSKWSKTCRTIAKRARYRLVLTGTPIAQGLQDVWAQFDLIDPTIFGPYADFEERYLIVKKISTATASWEKIIGYKNKEEFYRILHEHSYRITLNEARGKAIMTRRVPVYCRLEHEAQSLYDQVAEALEDEVEAPIIDLSGVLAQVMKLQQLCGGFFLEEQVSAAKETALLELLPSVQHQKIVVVCRFLFEIERLTGLLSQWYSVKQIRGGVEFDGKFDCDIIIIQVQAGVSIDLAEAQTIIFYSWDYSHINQEQIRYRIRSYHSTKVTEYYLICKDTVDEEIYTAVLKKKDLATLVCDKYRRNHDRERVEGSHQQGEAFAHQVHHRGDD